MKLGSETGSLEVPVTAYGSLGEKRNEKKKIKTIKCYGCGTTTVSDGDWTHFVAFDKKYSEISSQRYCKKCTGIILPVVLAVRTQITGSWLRKAVEDKERLERNIRYLKEISRIEKEN